MFKDFLFILLALPLHAWGPQRTVCQHGQNLGPYLFSATPSCAGEERLYFLTESPDSGFHWICEKTQTDIVVNTSRITLNAIEYGAARLCDKIEIVENKLFVNGKERKPLSQIGRFLERWGLYHP